MVFVVFLECWLMGRFCGGIKIGFLEIIRGISVCFYDNILFLLICFMCLKWVRM